jgi:outer membrane lipoprotein SlyB
MPALIGALAGMVVGCVAGNALFGTIGALCGCVIGVTAGTVIAMAACSAWTRAEIKKWMARSDKQEHR